jgi:hypothetical protein
METKRPDSPADEPIVDEPTPTYEEFLEKFAKEISGSFEATLFKGLIEFVRYLFTREVCLISLLVDKEVITQEEVNTYFGSDAHTRAQEAGVKGLRRSLLNAASSGKIVSPKGNQVNPDDILVILDDILDIDSKGWNGRSVETVFEFLGRGDAPRKEYDKAVAHIKVLNGLRAIRRGQIERTEQSNLEARRERLRRFKIYMSQCNIADKRLTEEDAQKMLDGTIPIPESA